jgi:hypothetical protein
MRANPKIGDIETAITELAVGEALVSFLDSKGRPSVTERVYVLPPGSQIGPITAGAASSSLVQLAGGRHLREGGGPRVGATSCSRAAASADAARRAGRRRSMADEAPTGGFSLRRGSAPPMSGGGGMMDMVKDMMMGSTGPRGGRKPGLVESAAQSAVKSIGSAVGREIIRGVLGSLLGGRRR